jgi:hypothetical protein
MCKEVCEASYRNLKVDKLVCEGRDGVVEAEAVFTREVRCEDVITLALLLAFQNDLFLARLFRRSGDRVVNYSWSALPSH